MTLLEGGGCCPRWRLWTFGLIASMLTVGTVVRVLQEGSSLGFSLHGSTTTPSPSPPSTPALILEQWKEKLGCSKDITLDVCWNKIELIVEKDRANQKVVEERTAIALYIYAAGDPYPNIKLINQHPALIPFLPQYQPQRQWQNDFPDLNVVGMAKAGTSQLYQILSQHAGAIPLDATEKEVCMLGAMHTVWELEPVSQEMTAIKAQVQANLYQWHSGLANMRMLANHNQPYYSKNNHQSTVFSYANSHLNETTKQEPQQQKQIVNGCVNWHDLWLHLHYTKPVTKKYFVVLRDPADWLWATWNYWIDQSLDSYQNGNEKMWASADHHYRSPELFHELILSDIKTNSAANMLIGLKQGTAVYGRRLVSLVGRENVMFLRNEDLLPERIDVAGVLDRISNFTGLDRHHFQEQGLHSFTNCNNRKGLTHVCGNMTTARGSYEISGNRTMLRATRKIIYLKFFKECILYANEFGIVYPDCLHVMDSAAPR
jgi:hypothetical protein